ncbi:MAG: oligosaccharide flippase family protein, partial [Dehalococcoidia bacterium]
MVRDAGRVVAPHSLRKNAAWMFGGQAVTWVLTAATLALLPRYLGPADMGRIGIGIAFSQLTMTIAGLGIATLVTREVARHRESATEIIATAFWLSVALGTLGACITLAISMALGYETLTWIAIAVFAATVPFDLLLLFGFGVLQGFEVMRYHAIWDVANKLFLLCCLAVVVVFDLGLPVFLAASFLSAALPALAVVRLMRRFTPFSPRM